MHRRGGAYVLQALEHLHQQSPEPATAEMVAGVVADIIGEEAADIVPWVQETLAVGASSGFLRERNGLYIFNTEEYVLNQIEAGRAGKEAAAKNNMKVNEDSKSSADADHKVAKVVEEEHKEVAVLEDLDEAEIVRVLSLMKAKASRRKNGRSRPARGGRRLGRRLGRRSGRGLGRRSGRRLGRRSGRGLGRRSGRRLGRRLRRRSGRRFGGFSGRFARRHGGIAARRGRRALQGRRGKKIRQQKHHR